MSDRLYPCTAADPMGGGPQNGLLGDGDLPWPSDLAARQFPAILDIGGIYSADDLSAAEFLIVQLQSAEPLLNEQEVEEYLLMLHSLLGRLKSAGEMSRDEFLKLKRRAESIPVVGPLLFSTAVLPGTLASLGGVIHASSKATKIENLLGLDEATRAKLRRWAAARGKPGSVSAKRAFRGRIKLVRKGGNLYFEIPASAKASIYRVFGRTLRDSIHLPAYHTAKALGAAAHVDSAAYGQRGIGRVLTGGVAGPVLAFGPQLALDISSSSSTEEFLKKSAYSQPTNAVVFAGGVIVGMIGAPAVVIISATISLGVVLQFLMSDEVTGWGNSLGDLLTDKD